MAEEQDLETSEQPIENVEVREDEPKTDIVENQGYEDEKPMEDSEQTPVEEDEQQVGDENPEQTSMEEEDDKPVEDPEQNPIEEPQQEDEMETKASQLYSMLSEKEMSPESKEQVAAMIKENPELLTSDVFMAKMAPLDMNRCPDQSGDYTGYIEKSAQQLSNTSNVLSNLSSLHKEGLIGEMKGGKTPVQYVLDEGRLPNGETLGTQTVKNTMYLRAMKNDEAYTNKSGIAELEFDNSFLLEQMYGKDEYGANPNRRNAKGQKVGDLMANHLSEKARYNTSDNVPVAMQTDKPKETPARGTLSVEELKSRAYQGTLTVEQANQLKKADDAKKEGDMNADEGDSKRPNTEASKDTFKDEDIVKYMYENWILGGLSAGFNKVEVITLDLIDRGCEMFVSNASSKRQSSGSQNKEKDEKTSRIAEFGEVYGAVNKGREDAYDQKIKNYKDIFADLTENLNNPNPQWRHNFDEGFLNKLKADPKAGEFLGKGAQAIQSQVEMLKATDQLGMLMASVAMTDEFLRDEKAWQNADGTNKSKKDLQEEMEKRGRENQKKLLEAIANISEDTRIMSEIAWEKLPEDKRPPLAEFTQAQINAEVNAFIAGVAKDIEKANESQKKDITRGKVEDGSKKTGTAQHLENANEKINTAIAKGEVYKTPEFTQEKSTEQVAVTCGLYEEAAKQNMPSIYEKMREKQEYQSAILDFRQQDVEKRRAQLEIMKERLEIRDGKEAVDQKIQDFTRNKGGRS
ncbi:MAG: hypothetical protein IJW75_00480 [Alphaproteobacteria bacterium]|nr:hypothetical protein [Alphaproteobacteria bacterium]